MKKQILLKPSKLLMLSLLVCSLMFSATIYAQPPGYGDAVYNVTTGTWFKMIAQNGNWYNADASAQSLLNTAGWTSRLAVLDNTTLHSFGRTLPGMGPWHIVWIYECDINNGWKLGGTGYNSIVCQNKNDIQGEYIAEFIPPPPCTNFEEIMSADICDQDFYTWRGNDYYQSGTYYDSLFTSNPPGCDSVYVLNLTVHPLPSVSINSIDTFYCVYNDSVILSGLPAGGIFSGNGVYGNVFYPDIAGAGTWTITYTYTDSNSCAGFTEITITVDDCLSVKYEEGSQMLIYPVPFSDMLTMEIHSVLTSDLIWNIFSVDGKLVRKGTHLLNPGMNHFYIDTRDLLPGIYIIRSTLNGTINTSDIIKH